ncbi:transcriptional regulator, SARP family [Planomonospora sphaerica]|uniref:Transcriptional regulator, SARP family n=1 Tax=Planomonospora sphaerica TaxID=161355 RepID=A0A161LAU2_9ACTN|nr:BTAD domain-containing putative transcriptional regulator [Planomonospora sphaerica]GAT65044.1 transcriptional regulator, SARP family [Planomonospora sphaerica]
MRFSVLGVLTVRHADGGLVPVRRRKHRQLLVALLLRANTPVSGGHLTESLWGAAPPPSAEQNLKTYVHTLRKLLSPDDPRSAPITTHGAGYLITLRPDDLDLLVFQDLVRHGRRAAREGDPETACRCFEQALGLWRGDALQDAGGSGVLDRAAGHLTEERLSVLEELAELQLHLGRNAEAVSRLRAAAAGHPLRERLQRQLMLGLHLSGDRAGALDAYQRFRKALVTETGLDPGRDVQELHRRILTSGSGPVPPASDRATRPAGPRPEPPRQLPRDLAGFVGRAEELVRLRSLLAPWDGGPPHHVVAITGPPGSGKSALAVRAAHAVGRDFPDGWLYTNLHGATPGLRRLEPLEVLGRFLRDLGVSPQAVPDDVDGAAALWRTRLDGRRVLVVLDDAADLAQIRPLLSVPVGSTILVTSRESFALVDDCARVRIGELLRTEASAMFAKLIGAGRAADDVRATGRLIELCGRLPLAVGIAGARLANRPRWTVADLVERLEDERRRLHELEAGDLAVRSSLAVSYDLLAGGAHPLDRLAARTLRMLGVLQVADVTPLMVAALLGGPAEEAERAMERLVDAHLAECDEPGRYRLHDLVRLFARERAALQDPEETTAALNRVLDFYTATAVLAGTLLRYPSHGLPEIDLHAVPAPLTSREQAYEWMEEERANLLSVAFQAMASPGERTVRLGAALAIRLHWHLLYGHHVSYMLTVNRRMLEAARRLGDRSIEALAHNHTGVALCARLQLPESVAHFERHLAISRELGNAHGEQRALGGLARSCFEMGRYEEAVGHAEAQRVIARRIGHSSGEYYALGIIGEAYHRLGRFDQALAVLEKSLSLSRRDGNVYQQGSELEALGELHLSRGEPALAKSAFTDALDCVRTIRMVAMESYLLLGLARSCRLLGELDQAAAHAWQAVETSRGLRDSNTEQKALAEHAAIEEARRSSPRRAGPPQAGDPERLRLAR